jgi:hypothetical protein
MLPEYIPDILFLSSLPKKPLRFSATFPFIMLNCKVAFAASLVSAANETIAIFFS